MARDVDKIVMKMSLEDKARQLTQLHDKYFNPETKNEMTGVDSPLSVTQKDVYGIGSVLNVTKAEEVLDVQRKYLSENKAGVPLSFMMDVIHGYSTIFPIPLAMGGTFDENLLEECAEMSAKEAKANGISITFSPMVDLVRDARWGRVMESTGEDHYLNGRMGRAFIRGYHKGGIGCCVKHFAAYGAPEAGREYNTTDISDRNLKEYYLPAYKACLEESPEMFMTSFNLLNGIPMNGRKDLLVDVLRNEWDFDGVVISDFNGIKEMIAHGYLETEKECAYVCLNNEVDVEMMSSTYIHCIPALVQTGELTEEKVDKSVRRVLKMKEQLGLFENPTFGADAEKAKALCLCETHREIARKAAEKAIVLLKNDKVLPIAKHQEIAVVGPFAKEQDILGAWSCVGKANDAISIMCGLENLLQKEIPTAIGCTADLFSEDKSYFPEAVSICKNAEVIIACIGESKQYSGEAAARAKIELPKIQISLLKELKKTGKKVVAVIFGGRPQVLTEVEKYADAILYAWQPGTEGGNAIARLLYGEAVPSAKLTMSFPRTTGQCPIYYNEFSTGKPKALDTLEGSGYNSSYRDELNKPLYPFGYGLSYTCFEIRDLRLSQHTMKRGEKIIASVKVKNVGKYAGEEVVQLYIRDKFASVVRPVKELKGYKKILCQVQEEKEVSFAIDEEMLCFFDAQNRWIAENGAFEVMIGNSSENVLKDSFILED